MFRQDAQAQRLETIPGLGAFLATLLRVEIDQVERFKSAAHLCNYTGLTTWVHQSGNRRWTEKINKQGNRLMRWAVIEAVSPAISHDPELRRYYWQIRRRRGDGC